MKNSILMVADNYVIGGLETHIRDLSEALMEQGADVVLVTGKGASDKLLPQNLTQFFPVLHAATNMSYAMLKEDIDFIREQE